MCPLWIKRFFISWKRRTQHWHDPGLCCGLVVTLQQLQSNRKNVTLTVKGTVWRLSKYDCPRTEKTDFTRAFMTCYVSVALMYLHLHSVLTEHSECFRLEETNSRLYNGLFCSLYFKFFLGVRQQQCEPLDHSDNQPNKRLETGVNSCLANNHDFKASM